MDDILFERQCLKSEENSTVNHESKPYHYQPNFEAGNVTEMKMENDVYSKKPAKPLEYESDKTFTSIKSCPEDLRISVIHSNESVAFQRQASDSEESSGGSSLILDEDSDVLDEPTKQLDADHSDYEPSVDPSEIECVVTDTSGDESSDSDERDSSGRIKNCLGTQLSCSLCAYVASDDKGLGELLKHLQGSHKFAVRGLRNTNNTDDAEDGSANKQKQQKKWFMCCRTKDGCGAVFFSKQGLLSHHRRSKSAGGTCWHVGTHEQGKAPLSCTICTFQCTSRREMLKHLKTDHNCQRDGAMAMGAFALSCRICDAQFWTAAERSQHEVSEHSNEAKYLLLKCYICFQSYSSKVCLTRHMRSNHSDEEQFFGSIGFRCRMCYLMFPTFVLVEEHFRRCHSSLLVFRCQKCSLILKTKKTYLVHMKNTQCGSVRQECTLCSKVLWSKRALSIHYRMKHFSSNRVGFLCRICKKRFDSKTERMQHYDVDHQGDSPFSCPICLKGFASKSGMYGHRQTHAKMSSSKCEFCGKEFSRRDSYNEHLLIHNGPRHKCPHCNKEFVQRSNLIRHIRIHTGEKPYKCSYCEKTFSDKGACNSHIRVHTREEACGCPYCGQIFSKKQKLKYHIRKHTGEGLVNCEFCGKTFTNSHSLKEHRMIHDHRTQIMCNQCGKAFSTAKYLQRHISMVHEAILVHSCPLCSRGFSQLARLKTHIMTHSGIKHLQCLLCTKAYSSQKSLRSHLLNIHSVTTEHPDYKQCFYAMTPEEAGLQIPKGHNPPRQPLLRTKSEPLSANSDLDSENNESSSSDEGKVDDGDGSDEEEPPKLEQQDPLRSSLWPPPPFTTIRTKAARKQLPFNVIVTEKKGNKSSNRRFLIKSQEEKNVGARKVNSKKTGAGMNGSRQVCCEENFGNNKNVKHSNSSSESFQLKSVDALGKNKTYELSHVMDQPVGSVTRQEGQNDGYVDQSEYISKVCHDQAQATSNSEQFEPASSRSNLPKSNRRARYKLQTPKKLCHP